MYDRNFFFYVKKTRTCWFWTGCRHPAGYGAVNRGGRAHPAHRWSWILANGPIPSGKWVLHKCDVRACVRPSHLFLGNAQDNVDDMIRKGRDKHDKCAFGEKHANAKLNEAAVRDIRSSNRSLSQMAKKYGVCFQSIWHVRKNKTWKHIK